MLVKSDGSAYTTVRLTGVSNVTVGGTAYVKLSHSSLTIAPLAGPSPPATNGGTNVVADDPTGMSVNSGDQTVDKFCATDYIIRLLPVQYCVDTTTDPTNPTLRRQNLVGLAATPLCASGTALANQIIGFKVGATVTASSAGNDLNVYNFNSQTFGTGPNGNDYTQIHSVMVSMIGRTTPNPDPSYLFRNTFDGGPYQIQGASVVVNPRNMNF
jgi:hypothetical protein